MEVPQIFMLTIPPLVVTPLIGYLNNPRMPQWLRCLIASLVIIVVALACALYVHAFTGNVVNDFVIVAGWSNLLATTILEPLYKMVLYKTSGPFAAFFKQPEPAAPVQVQTPPTAKDLTSGN